VGATGAGAEMGRSLGTAVFAGILGVTGFGLIFTNGLCFMNDRYWRKADVRKKQRRRLFAQ
jgi:HAE1 family hydrophobic/amphiphilic exporter-1